MWNLPDPSDCPTSASGTYAWEAIDETLPRMVSADDADMDRVYREVIDRLVHDCRQGQGQIGPSRVRGGVWNKYASATQFPDQHEINTLLKRMPTADRDTVAGMLEGAFVAGVHSALVALHEAGLAPFDKAYEGTPFHDFVGRLDDWQWPKSAPRS